MDTLKYCRALLVTLASVGVVLPGHLWADPPRPNVPHAGGRGPGSDVVGDVALGSGGTLRGVVFDVQAHPVPRQVVVLRGLGRQLGRTTTDDQGRFEFCALRGGVYSLSAGGVSHVFRVWTADAAPPTSVAEVALVTGDVVQRGQRPFAELFVADPIVLGVILAAAIAIPIAVHNSRSDRPAS